MFPHVSTMLEVIAGWCLFNVLFAVAMYFRPKRPRDRERELRAFRTVDPLIFAELTLVRPVRPGQYPGGELRSWTGGADPSSLH